MRAVEGLRGEYPLELLLRVSGMSRSTYYHRLRSLRSRACLHGTDALISEIFQESGREYGCRKVAAVLGRRGVSMNFKTVNRRMRSMGLAACARWAWSASTAASVTAVSGAARAMPPTCCSRVRCTPVSVIPANGIMLLISAV